MAPNCCHEFPLIYKTLVFLINKLQNDLEHRKDIENQFCKRALRRSTCVYFLIQMMTIADKSIANIDGWRKYALTGVCMVREMKAVCFCCGTNTAAKKRFITLGKYFK
jgi:hypothetical protein